MLIDVVALRHAVVLLLFVAAGLVVSLVLALGAVVPWWAALAPSVAATLVGHGVAARLAEPGEV